ncbi:hypothetical protein UNSWCS_27 [Campylobacter concisus UNSWCS]|uniref:Uncharacterized protein n=1 Tax=Campylobacter concisus UNSWCS TaxID=1242968 RepID=U2GRA9_9BACT|nr:hypothetical protein UNSWCS_27 [Campylobacter concisus UNSWCS]
MLTFCLFKTNPTKNKKFAAWLKFIKFESGNLDKFNIEHGF